MKFIGIIPARYASSRFPGKPLAMLGGRPVIEHTYRRAGFVLAETVVATDDLRILNCVEEFGGRAVMTSENHRSGTDRCLEAYRNTGSDADIIINIQGDEPFIHPSQIKAVMECFDDPTVDIATLCRPFPADAPYSALADPNTVKLVTDLRGNAMYFSRSLIPYDRELQNHPEELASTGLYQAHVGLYAYRAAVLEEIASLEQSPLEKAESLEQLRWLQNGYRIRVARTVYPTVGIDTPADLEAANRYLTEIDY